MTVGTTAVEIPGASGSIQAVQNLGPGVVYLGGAGVTTANGLKIDVDQTYEPAVPFSGDRYVVSDTAGTDVRLLGA